MKYHKMNAIYYDNDVFLWDSVHQVVFLDSCSIACSNYSIRDVCIYFWFTSITYNHRTLLYSPLLCWIGATFIVIFIPIYHWLKRR